MKKLFVPVIFLFLGFMIAQSGCDEKKKNITAADNTKGEVNHDSLPCKACGDYSNLSAFQGLPVNLLLDMTDRYRKNISIPTSLIFKGTNQQDAHSVWLDLDSLKRFIWEIESRSCAVKCKESSNVKLGLRIYYGRYPGTGTNAGTNTDLSVLSEEYENRHTVFMVPTYSFNGNEPADYNAFDTFDIKKCTYPEIFAGDTVLVLSGGLTGRQTAHNHGGLCPPLCPSVAATRFGQ